MSVTLVIGTDKGGFIVRSDDARRTWKLDAPVYKGWKVTASQRLRDGTWHVATASHVYGCAVQVGKDLANLRQARTPPRYAEGDGRCVSQIWRLAAGHDCCFAGVQDAGLFVSRDGGDTWSGVEAINNYPSRGAWQAGNGGLCLHAIVLDPASPQRMWCGISAVGVYRTDDGGATWRPKNQGVPAMLEDKQYPDIGHCVHGLVCDPANASLLYRQDHAGMFRSRDGGDTWERNENGLGHWFGFPIAIDPASRTLIAAPLESDECRLPRDGKLTMYVSRNGGESWSPRSDGLPREPYYAGTLRGAIAVDGLSPGGVYFGTTAGDVFVSRDTGATWERLPLRLPRILSVGAYAEA